MAKKRTVKKKTPAKKSVNRSQAIRDYLKEHPQAGPTAIQAALAKDGIDISRALASKVKAGETAGTKRKPAVKKKTVTKKTARKKTAARKTTAKKKAAGRTESAEPQPVVELIHAASLMLQAVELVMKAGVDGAELLIDSAADVVKRIRE